MIEVKNVTKEFEKTINKNEIIKFEIKAVQGLL